MQSWLTEKFMWTFFRETNNHRFKTTYILRNPFTGWKINGTPQNSCYCCWYLELVQPENELFGHDFHWTIDRRKSQKMSGNQKTCKILFLPTSQFWGGNPKLLQGQKRFPFVKFVSFTLISSASQKKTLYRNYASTLHLIYYLS